MANWNAAGGWRLGTGGEVGLRGRAAYQLPQSVLMSLQMPAAARARLKTKADRLSIMLDDEGGGGAAGEEAEVEALGRSPPPTPPFIRAFLGVSDLRVPRAVDIDSRYRN